MSQANASKFGLYMPKSIAQLKSHLTLFNKMVYAHHNSFQHNNPDNPYLSFVADHVWEPLPTNTTKAPITAPSNNTWSKGPLKIQTTHANIPPKSSSETSVNNSPVHVDISDSTTNRTTTSSSIFFLCYNRCPIQPHIKIPMPCLTLPYLTTAW